MNINSTRSKGVDSKNNKIHHSNNKKLKILPVKVLDTSIDKSDILMI